MGAWITMAGPPPTPFTTIYANNPSATSDYPTAADAAKNAAGAIVANQTYNPPQNPPKKALV
jgi:hypothetical protein